MCYNNVKNTVALGDCVSARIVLVHIAFILSPTATVYVQYSCRKPVYFPWSKNKGKSHEIPNQRPSWLTCPLSWVASRPVQLSHRENSAPPNVWASPGYGCWRFGSPFWNCPHLGFGMGLAEGTLRVCSNSPSWLLSQDADAHQPPCSKWAFCSEPISNGMEHSSASFWSLDRPGHLAFPHRLPRSEQLS